MLEFGRHVYLTYGRVFHFRIFEKWGIGAHHWRVPPPTNVDPNKFIYKVLELGRNDWFVYGMVLHYVILGRWAPILAKPGTSLYNIAR